MKWRLFANLKKFKKIRKILFIIFRCKYFGYFIGEMIMNPKYNGYRAGRFEVHDEESEYSIDEYRYFTNKKSFKFFDKLVDFKQYNKIELSIIRYILKNYYCNYPNVD